MISGNISGEIMRQAQPQIQKMVDEKIQQIIQVVQMRWQDRVNHRISEAEWAVRQGRIYDPEHALMKIYDAYKWVAEHVKLDVEIVRNSQGADITMRAATNDDSPIDDYRSERIGECIGDLTKQVNYDYF